MVILKMSAARVKPGGFSFLPTGAQPVELPLKSIEVQDFLFTRVQKKWIFFLQKYCHLHESL
jgi:hypothetical protein